MNKLIVAIIVTLITGCLPIVPQDVGSGVKTTTINNFSPADYAGAYGADCSKVDLAKLAQMTKLTDTGCALVAKVINSFALDVKGSGTAPECNTPIPAAG